MTEAMTKLLPYKVEAMQNTATTEIPYGVRQCQAPSIWEQGEKGKGIVVAICDTGIDVNHPDLKNRIVGGRNFTTEGSREDYRDKNGHGTHVAGTIAGNGAIQGVAPEADLLICKVLDGNGSGSYYSIIEGIKYATKWKGENGERVRVINMSLGGSYNDKNLEKAILEACAQGILVVAASGNEGDRTNEGEANETTYEYGYPALYNECITVAACDEGRKLAYFSNNHLQVDIISAGVDVLSTYPTSQYARLSGTSMATPHVAGMLALVIKIGEKQFKRPLNREEVYALLVKCSCSLGYEKSSEGNGLPELSQIYKHC